jgi:TolB-like protein/DNA-binding winged helix-turn-helix (wHTH) protein/Tfp pilus assembly protein PilF
VQSTAQSGSLIRFGVFELDLCNRELRKKGVKVKLQQQPLDLLKLLLERRPDAVTREEIRERLWPVGVHVDFDRSLNKAVVKLREALGDDAESPRFVETMPRYGYRFIAPVATDPGPPEQVEEPTPAILLLKAETVAEPSGQPLFPSAVRNRRLVLAIAGIGLVLGSAWFFVLPLWRASGTGAIHSLAILPLQNLSGDPSQNYFADGITDELTTDLARIGSLRVISRTSTMRYAGHSKTMAQVAKELNVDAVIEGSVVRSGNRVRITAQLIDARRDTHLWAQSYERDLGEILELQGSVALNIAEQVKASLSTEERVAFQSHRSIKPEAYEAYLRGRNEIGKQTQDSMRSSVQYFQRAIDLDPFYAGAYAGLADSFSLLANYGVRPPKEVFPRAEAAARKAMELEPSLGEAHASFAFVRHHFDWDWSGAEAEYKRALQLSPGLPQAHLRYAEYLSNAGRHEEALREISRARDLDPLSLTVASNVGRILFYARRYDEAIREMTDELALNPNRIYPRIHLAMAYEQKRMYAEGIAESTRVAAITGESGVGLAEAYAIAGQSKEAKQILRDVESPSPSGTLDWVFIAAVYAALGDKDRAFSWLEKGYENRDWFMTYLKVYPGLDPLRSDPRFGRLMTRIGIPPGQ